MTNNLLVTFQAVILSFNFYLRAAMKKIILVAALFLAGVAALPTFAATAAPGNFDVSVSLTSACVYSKTNHVSFNYVSFQTAAQAQTTAGAFMVKCTNSLPYTLSLDGSSSYTDAALNLAYTLTPSASSAVGTGVAQPFAVIGSMAGGPTGTCASPSGACSNSLSANKQRTLTITY